MRNLLALASLLIGLAIPAKASYSFGPAISTNTGISQQGLAGQFYVAGSSVNISTIAGQSVSGSTWSIIINGPTGLVSASSFTALSASYTATGNNQYSLTTSSGISVQRGPVNAPGGFIGPIYSTNLNGLIPNSLLDSSSVTKQGNIVPVTGGGTGAITAPAALTNLGAAASGANADITSMSAFKTNSANLTETSTLTVTGNNSGVSVQTSTSVLMSAGGVCWGNTSNCQYAPAASAPTYNAVINNNFTASDNVTTLSVCYSTLTITTGANPVMIWYSGAMETLSNVTVNMRSDFLIDGARQDSGGASSGIATCTSYSRASSPCQMSWLFISPALSAATHNICIQFATDTAATFHGCTSVVGSGTGAPCQFGVKELKN